MIILNNKWIIGIIFFTGLFVFIVIPFLVNESMSINIIKTYGTVESWIGFLGSYIGGFIGGAIAALVASYIAKLQVDQIQKQIDESKRSEKENWFLRQYPAVVKLQFEVEKIIKNYTKLEWKKIKILLSLKIYNLMHCN